MYFNKKKKINKRQFKPSNNYFQDKLYRTIGKGQLYIFDNREDSDDRRKRYPPKES